MRPLYNCFGSREIVKPIVFFFKKMVITNHNSRNASRMEWHRKPYKIALKRAGKYCLAPAGRKSDIYLKFSLFLFC